MIEICKQITINIFWVLAAIFQVTFVTAIIVGVLNSILEKIHKRDEEE